jgi:CRP-like cAMP-binding protein
MSNKIFNVLGLPQEELIVFKDSLSARQLKKGEYFITEGQPSIHLAFIESGYLRTFHLDKKGNEITTEFNGPGKFCSSYYSFYSQLPSYEYIEAVTDCRLFLISFAALQKLYAHNLQINVMGRKVLEKACMDRDYFLKRIIHLPAKEKYEWFLQVYPEVYKSARLQDIASFLGIKPETLSRIRRKLSLNQ